jgi:hypothetical protein
MPLGQSLSIPVMTLVRPCTQQHSLCHSQLTLHVPSLAASLTNDKSDIHAWQAIKGYTGTANRGFAFGLFYSIMNVGALLSGFLVDGLTLCEWGPRSRNISPYRYMYT